MLRDCCYRQGDVVPELLEFPEKRYLLENKIQYIAVHCDLENAGY